MPCTRLDGFLTGLRHTSKPSVRLCRIRSGLRRSDFGLTSNSGDNVPERIRDRDREAFAVLHQHFRIPYYEMWNEPDLTRNWTGTPD